MAEADVDVAALMERVLQGDKDAAVQLHAQYGPYILRAVRKRLHHKLRSKFDSLDFVQDVWASFFRNLPDNHQFETPDDLVAFLTTVARNKMAEVSRARLQGQKYNLHREEGQADEQTLDQYASNADTPSQILMGQEAWDRLLAKEPLVYRRILILFRQGRPTERIAADLGLSLKTVQRTLRRVWQEVRS